ncbi:MAG: hypothetical protein K0S11_1696 [Gammaproteobacteria bacterium]|jgi:ribosome-associated protein|nr:hypothetical protein [Gammaproteobacteria bacterium]
MDNQELDPLLPPSKSQLKREMEARQKLGERLLDLSVQQLNQLALSSQLIEAVALAKRIKAHGGRYRQLQYIGKLMRSIDPTPIEDFFKLLDGKDYAQTVVLHELEDWRERLITAIDNGVLTDYLNRYPQADSQQLRQLVQAAKKERETTKPLGAGRKLFQYLRQQLS